jgi:AcrR family transcriptional regulator
MPFVIDPMLTPSSTIGDGPSWTTTLQTEASPVNEHAMTPSDRPIRADAQANHDRLLEVAARAFARAGADTSLKAIAAEAGVGIGTLYRRFPTRDDLIEATYRGQTTQLCESAPRLLAQEAPVAALTQWMELFVDYMVTKQGMADALPAILASREGLRLHSRQALKEAVATLLDGGIAAGRLREDVAAEDVLMALGGITLISAHEQQRDLASRLIALLVDGLAAARDSS